VKSIALCATANVLGYFIYVVIRNNVPAATVLETFALSVSPLLVLYVLGSAASTRIILSYAYTFVGTLISTLVIYTYILSKFVSVIWPLDLSLVVAGALRIIMFWIIILCGNIALKLTTEFSAYLIRRGN
jgi:hypothetical protein